MPSVKANTTQPISAFLCVCVCVSILSSSTSCPCQVSGIKPQSMWQAYITFISQDLLPYRCPWRCKQWVHSNLQNRQYLSQYNWDPYRRLGWLRDILVHSLAPFVISVLASLFSFLLPMLSKVRTKCSLFWDGEHFQGGVSVVQWRSTCLTGTRLRHYKEKSLWLRDKQPSNETPSRA